jgi:hypothetical protein
MDEPIGPRPEWASVRRWRAALLVVAAASPWITLSEVNAGTKLAAEGIAAASLLVAAGTWVGATRAKCAKCGGRYFGRLPNVFIAARCKRCHANAWSQAEP